MSECKIESIKLKLGKREITLSLEDAKNLKGTLDELFGKEIIREYHGGYWYWQWPPYGYQTVYTNTDEPQITWTTTSNMYALMDSSTDTLCLTAR